MRIRLPGGMFVISGKYKVTLNGVRESAHPSMYMWWVALFLQVGAGWVVVRVCAGVNLCRPQRHTGLPLYPTCLLVPNIAVSSDLFHFIDFPALLAADPNTWTPPGDFTGLTKTFPHPDNRTIILYRNGVMMLSGPSIEKNVELAAYVMELGECARACDVCA